MLHSAVSLMNLTSLVFCPPASDLNTPIKIAADHSKYRCHSNKERNWNVYPRPSLLQMMTVELEE